MWNVFQNLQYTTTGIHFRAHCVELLLARYYFFFTYAEDNYIRVNSLCDRRLTAPNITVQLNECCEKMCQHPLRGEDSVKLAYMAEMLSRNNCRGNKTISKGSIGARYCSERNYAHGSSKHARICLACKMRSGGDKQAIGEIKLTSSWSEIVFDVRTTYALTRM